MRQLVRPLMLLAALAGCTPDSRTDAERLAAAARADSSAAGYEVGPIASGPTPGTLGSDSLSHRPDSTGGRGSQGAPTGQKPAPSPGPGDTLKPAVSSGPAGRGSDSTRNRVPAPNTRGRDSATTQRPLDPALEANFLAYDSAKKTATFQLAADDEIPDEVSFNASRRGGRTLTIPLGWRVTIAFTNRDTALTHSATIVDVSGPIPEKLPEPVFLRGQTMKVDEGLLEGDTDEIVFLADRVGRYLLACGVLGHAQRGQWITLDVSTTAAVPKYR